MDELKMLHSFVNDLWRFIKVYHDARGVPDRYWDEVISEINTLCGKYDNHPAVVRTVLGYADWLEHEGAGKEKRNWS